MIITWYGDISGVLPAVYVGYLSGLLQKIIILILAHLSGQYQKSGRCLVQST
jgi:hypothetical protein